MPKRAWIVNGLAWGDESKGAYVDFLTEQTGAQLVVRYNGGAQAAHSVERDGIKHVFHQFGSGTLLGARTHLSRFHLFNPVALLQESEQLKANGILNPLGMVSVDPRALITTPYHVAANRIRERMRHHGSCGMGIGETVEYAMNHKMSVMTARDIECPPRIIRNHLTEIRRNIVAELHGCGHCDDSGPDWDLLTSEEELDATIELYQYVNGAIVTWSDSAVIGHASLSDEVIFEGAQGILLDEKWGEQPHTTWSNCTTENARALVSEVSGIEPYALGLTRCYATRHGNGPMPTFDSEMTKRMSDPNNPENEWQGSMRFGQFDIEAFKYAIGVSGGLNGIAVSCLDQIDLAYNGKTGTDDLLDAIGSVSSVPIVSTAYGPTAKDRKMDVFANV